MAAEAHHPIIEPIVLTDDATVVGLYEPVPREGGAHQSEAELEAALIRQLRAQAYEYVRITDEAALTANLRARLEDLNDYRFSDDEWKRFFEASIRTPGDSVIEKARRIQEDHVQSLIRDNGETKNIYLIDKQNVHRNSLQVINQYEATTASRSNRYDVTILVNGLPLVHIELKRRGVVIRDAFNQISRYQRDSFWAGAGLFGYVQVFVISNGTHTKYYSNTVRLSQITENQSGRREVKAAASKSFEFTSWWSDAANNPITDLVDFTRTFFAKHTLLAVLTRYCVLTVEDQLMVMRPYQIAATEAILRRINSATLNKQTGRLAAGGYIWHTTGSGKTLTSFKTAKLAAGMEGIDKVLFVVDRKDLDHQTIKEYNRFAAGTVSANQSTRQLAGQINDPGVRIIVTTIQKLSNFVSSTTNRGHTIYGGHVVIIFDECHRSQFGDMHAAITKAFRNYHLFGFTGTPIFAQNASSGGKANLRTTAQAFGDQLHSYTIADAIRDNNVLPFRIDYVNSFSVAPHVDAKLVAGIDTETAFMDPRHISQVVTYIREHFDQKTLRHSSYTLSDRRVRGFNSLFATASIKAARAYYQEFARQQRGLPQAQRLSVGIIYSYAPNAEAPDAGGFLSEEGMDPSALTHDDRDFLDMAIRDYNRQFDTNFDSSAQGFEGYYADISRRLSSKQIDLVIVVDMFLTGFDSKSLNTLWVDKNLRSHGLIQAFSRTNRILNSVKTYGNIVCFRNLEQETEDAIALFGNKEARGQVLLKSYQEYLDAHAEAVAQLRLEFPLPLGLIASEDAQRGFVVLFGKILRLRNILASFDDFAADDPISARDIEDYRSAYLDLYQEMRQHDAADKEPINEDLVFEIELVKQVEVNVDYVLMLVEQHRASRGDGNDVEIPVEITRALKSSPSLRDKRDLIEDFYRRVSLSGDVATEFARYVAERREAELEGIIERENLRENASEFAHRALAEGFVSEEGTGLSSILPHMSRFARGGGRAEKKARVLDALRAWVSRFMNLGGW